MSMISFLGPKRQIERSRSVLEPAEAVVLVKLSRRFILGVHEQGLRKTSAASCSNAERPASSGGREPAPGVKEWRRGSKVEGAGSRALLEPLRFRLLPISPAARAETLTGECHPVTLSKVPRRSMVIKSSVSLRADQHAFARALVASGRFPSVSAVLQQGLDLLQQQDADAQADRAALQALLLQRADGPFLSAEDLRSAWAAQRP